MKKASFSKQTSFLFNEINTFPPIFPGEIHIWNSRLVPNQESLRYFQSLLDAEEQKRVSSFQFANHKHRFILAHGYLRCLLGYYAQKDPKGLLISQDHSGKPVLKSHPIKFNLSHSEDMALFAFSLDDSIGVDIEKVRCIPEAVSIISRLFTKREYWIYLVTAKEKKPEIFCKFWTRGEALVKAIGTGFGEKVGAISRGKLKKAGKLWNIETFSPAPGFVGTLAFTQTPRRILCQSIQSHAFHQNTIKQP